MTTSHRVLFHPETVDPSLERAFVVGDDLQALRTVRPKNLEDPAPDTSQLRRIFSAPGAAPDHGRVQPRRFINVPASQRGNLADAFAQSSINRDPLATNEQASRARENVYRSPWLMLVAVDGQRGNIEIDPVERTLPAGCAVQNISLMATALGLGSALTSGKALKAKVPGALFGLQEGENAPCFINIGTAKSPIVRGRRPGLMNCVSVLGQAMQEHRDAVFQIVHEE